MRSTANGRRPAGRTWSDVVGASTTAGVAQKAQREAETPGSNVVVAPHFVHFTLLRSAPHPRLARRLERLLERPFDDLVGGRRERRLAPAVGALQGRGAGVPDDVGAAGAARELARLRGNGLPARGRAGRGNRRWGRSGRHGRPRSAGRRRRGRRGSDPRVRSLEAGERLDRRPAGGARVPGERRRGDLPGGDHLLQGLVGVGAVGLAVDGEGPPRGRGGLRRRGSGRAREGRRRGGRVGGRGGLRLHHRLERLSHDAADRHPGAEAGAGAGEPAGGVRRGDLDRLGGLHLRELPHLVAEDAELRPLVDRRLDLLGEGDVLDEELRELEAEAAELGAELPSSERRQLVVLGRDVERRDLRLGDRVGELGEDDRPELAGDLVRRRQPLRPDDRVEEDLRVGDLHRVGPEGADPDHPEVGVPHHDGVRRPPLQVGVVPGVEEVDLRLERGLEAVLPPAQGRQDRDVLRGELVPPRQEEVGRLPLVDEEGRLVLAHRQLRAHLDLLVVDGEPVDERVGRLVQPLDDLDELRADLLLDVVEQAHSSPPNPGGDQSSAMIRSGTGEGLGRTGARGKGRGPALPALARRQPFRRGGGPPGRRGGPPAGDPPGRMPGRGPPAGRGGPEGRRGGTPACRRTLSSMRAFISASVWLRRSTFSFARARSPAFWARIWAIRSAIGISSRSCGRFV